VENMPKSTNEPAGKGIARASKRASGLKTQSSLQQITFQSGGTMAIGFFKFCCNTNLKEELYSRQSVPAGCVAATRVLELVHA